MAAGPTIASPTRDIRQIRPAPERWGSIAPGTARSAGIRRLEAAMRKPWDPIAEMQAANRALKRTMLRDLEQMSRRELLRRGGRVVAGASAASILFKAGIPLIASAQEETPPLPEYDGIPENLKGTGEVRVQSWGGAFQDAQREAYFMPFQEMSGITVVESEGPDLSKIKAMVDTGNVEQDVVQIDRCRSHPPRERRATTGSRSTTHSSTSTTSTKAHRYKYLRRHASLSRRSSAIATTSSRKARRARPTSGTSDAFPGPRTTAGGSGGLTPFLEPALIADGVSWTSVYPIDIDRAYESLLPDQAERRRSSGKLARSRRRC